MAIHVRSSEIVERRSYKLDIFLSILAKRLTGTTNYNLVEIENVYFRGGWRGKIIKIPYGNSILGIKLINPSKSVQEIQIVTQAMNILLYSSVKDK